jgi:hypothetical protein
MATPSQNLDGITLEFEKLNESPWCKPHDHMVTQPIIKIEIWSWKPEISLIRVWHNENISQGTNTIGMK